MSALIEAHLQRLRAAGRAPATTIHDRRWLLTWADQALPHGIDEALPHEIEQLFARDDWSAWTRCTYWSHLSAFYDWACSGYDPWLTWNPMAELVRPRPPKGVPNPVTDEELAHALAHSDEVWQRVIVLAAYAGLRAGEICRLARRDVTAERIRIRDGKGGKTAEVPCHPEIWRRVADVPPGPVAVRQDLPLSARAREHFDKIGLPDVHLHRFRHWFATMLFRSGADILTVKELMRHDSIQTTLIYVQLIDGQRRLAVHALPVLHGPESASSQQNAA